LDVWNLHLISYFLNKMWAESDESSNRVRARNTWYFKTKFKVLLTLEGTFHVHENSCHYDTAAEQDKCLPKHCCSHYTACLSRSTLRGVGADRKLPCGLLSFTDPSWRHYDTHNNRLLRLGASCVSESHSATAAVRRCTDRRCRRHCAWWRSVWRRRTVGTLLLKFHKTTVVFGALFISVYIVLNFSYTLKYLCAAT
jgi:hypothetical protein